MNQSISPQPVPTTFGFDITEDGKFVVMVKQTFEGTNVAFVQLENIDPICEMMQQQKARALEQQGNLTVPSQVILGPDGQPVRIVPPSGEVSDHARQQAEREAAENAEGVAKISEQLASPGPDPAESAAGVSEAGESRAKPGTAGDAPDVDG